ncbi:MAG: hypothetical protein NT046_00245 [Arenimonas sp.]|nr:hypothetical protein [Arenimonas sp.]
MKPTLSTALAIGLMLAAGSASALEPACETYLRAAEKSASQPSRHSVTETGGVRLELVMTGGQAWTRFDGGKWQPVKRSGKADPLAAEKQFVAAIRAGQYPISGCRKLGTESMEGRVVTVYAYSVAVPGMPAGGSKAYIGADGLVYGQRSDEAVVRHRYTGVTAPKP